MKAQLNQMDLFEMVNLPEPQFIVVSIPDDFDTWELESQMAYVGDRLRSLEAQYPAVKDILVRHTTLVRTEKKRFIYSVDYRKMTNS